MAKKKGRHTAEAPAAVDKPATLKDLLNPDIVNKLKAQADSMKADEQQRREAQRKQEEEARKAEKKRLENDFEYLLNNSSADWKQHKS
ncbi:YqkE family protein [Paenibacillus puerhi]|uniref:YqkE family protein n=1 Tax=Paenibacillus puerhi TaxID=2692622 RepID=UPI00135BB206|nr:YqkE family protein [Paenibacillus puerhi]